VQSEYKHCLNLAFVQSAGIVSNDSQFIRDTTRCSHKNTPRSICVIQTKSPGAHRVQRAHRGDGKLHIVESGARAAKSLSENNSGRTGGRDGQQKTNHCSVSGENCWLGECK
jgi:hypothetical protein